MGPVGALQRALGGVRPRHTCRGLARLMAAVRPSEVGLSGARKAERSFGAMYFRGLVGPIGALQAIFGCVRPRHTCRGLARLTAAVEPSETGLSGARKAERSFGAMYFRGLVGPIGALQAVIGRTSNLGVTSITLRTPNHQYAAGVWPFRCAEPVRAQDGFPLLLRSIRGCTL